MHTVLKATLFAFVAAATLACGSDDDGTGGGFDDPQVIVDFADQVVIPTYQLLATRTVLLDDAISALAANRTEPNLAAAKAAWAAMREPWEQSEGFLFGPVSAQGWDPAMDSWPLNQTDLLGVLSSGDALTQAYVAALPETQKGFHTVEYVLWGEGGNKAATALTARELEYAVALAGELAAVTDDLQTSWTVGIDGQAAYRDVFTTAGADDNTSYPSLNAAAQEILGGMSGICDEVANGKIADPYDARDPNLVESQYSFNSLIDFADNIRSVRYAYNGNREAGSGRGLSEYIAATDPTFDAQVHAEIDAAIAAIGAIPSPFRTAIQDSANDALIETAQQAVRTLQSTIDGSLTARILE